MNTKGTPLADWQPGSEGMGAGYVMPYTQVSLATSNVPAREQIVPEANPNLGSVPGFSDLGAQGH